MATLKPLRPLQFEGQNLYPLTTYDQIIMPDGKKWNGTAGADVVIEPTITSGTKLATISVDGVSKDLYYQASDVTIEPTITSGTKLATVRVNGVSKDLYYQASAVTLNGSATTSANFYAPTSAGTAGQVLKSNGSGAPTWAAEYSYTLPTATSSVLGGVKVGSNITVSSGTISLTKANVTAALGYTPPTSDTNTTYSAGTGISLSGTTFSNSGVRSIVTGTSNGTISVNTNGKSANVAVKGLGSNAYTSTAYLPLAGGTMTGMITGFAQNSSWINITKKGCIHMGTAASSSSAAAIISMKTYSGSWGLAGLNGSDNLYFVWGSDTNYNNGTNTTAQTHITSSAQIYGAVWNDYAEYRSQNETIEPGYITYCDDDGKLKKTVKRLQKYEGVVSDTFGFAIGETDDCKTPLAVSGRALVYCDPEEEHFHSGDCVCAGPDGLAYRMTREEIIEFPDRVVGVVSEIPTYKTWGTGNVEVNGRIWIKVK